MKHDHDLRIVELGLILPPAPKPAGVYKPVLVVDKFLYVSGQGPIRSDGTLMTGKLGADLNTEEGKTHKKSEIIKMQMKHGMYKFKCATISETEMVASCGAKDILLAIQPVGPNLGRFFQLKQKFRGTKISCIADSEE